MLSNSADFGVYSMYKTIARFGISLGVLGLSDTMF